jgi:hypothetical protein
MADDEKDRDDDEPWGEGADVPPLSDVENPLADDDDREGDEESRDWVPPIP